MKNQKTVNMKTMMNVRKMMYNVLAGTFFLILGAGAVSCSNDDGDTTKPAIVLESPAEGETFVIGQTLRFKAKLSDDVMLGSYKVEIHLGTDQHDEDHKTTRHGDDDEEHFYYSKSFEVTGKNAEVKGDILIPADLDIENPDGDEYHFMLYCYDHAGNENYAYAEMVFIKAE